MKKNHREVISLSSGKSFEGKSTIHSVEAPKEVVNILKSRHEKKAL